MKSLKLFISAIILASLFGTLERSLLAQPNFIEGQHYIIEILSADKVLDVAEYSTAAGGRIHLWERHNGDNQLFRFEAQGNNMYTIIAKSSNMALEAPLERGTSINPVKQNHINGSAAQKFYIQPANVSGYFKIISYGSRTAVFGDGTQNGALVKTTRSSDYEYEMFRFVPYGSPVPAPTPQEVAPGIPTLVTPVTSMEMAHGAGVVWNFDWDDVPNADSYQIYVEHQNQTDRIINQITTASNYSFTFTSYIPDNLIKEPWGWWVRARTGNIWGPWSQPNVIYLEQKKIAPTLLQPLQNEMLENGNQTNSRSFNWNFDWQDVPGVESYYIEINSPFQNGFVTTTVYESHYIFNTTNSINADNLNGWSWQVNPIVNGAITEWSELRYFNVTPASIFVPSPQPVFPAQYAVVPNGFEDDFDGLRWNFRWNQTNGASQYEFKIINGSGANYHVGTSYSTEYTYEYPGHYIIPESLNNWSWQVRALVNGSWSDWSTPSYFSVLHHEEKAPKLNSFSNKLYKIRGGYLNAYISSISTIYAGDLCCITKLVIDEDGANPILFQMEGVSFSEEIYDIKIIEYESYYGTYNEIGYLSHDLKLYSNPGDEHWIIEPHPNGHYYIRNNGTNDVLQIMDIDYYNNSLHLKMQPKSGHDRQSFTFIQN